MKPILATNISEAITMLVQRAQVASTSSKVDGVPTIWRQDTAFKLVQVIILCEDLALPESCVAARRLQSELIKKDDDFSNQELLWKMDALLSLMQSEMEKHLYFSVQGDLTRYIDAKALFGSQVGLAFPSVELDLKEAGNCLALGRNAATIFHLMRVAEIGLWELGRDRQIPLAKSGKIEFTEWGLIIKELEDAVKAIQQWPNCSTKEDAHKFYNHAVVEIRAFNDGWRRHAAHARANMPPTSPEEARALWGHVERFMKTLAGRIAEGHYTNLIW
jgi:hypothetical protein